MEASITLNSIGKTFSDARDSTNNSLNNAVEIMKNTGNKINLLIEENKK